MDGAKLVACVHPPPPLLRPLFLRQGGSVHRLLNVLLCHWLRRGVLRSVRAAETVVVLSVLN